MKNYEFVYIAFDADRYDFYVFRSKVDAIQYMVNDIKRQGYHYYDNENIDDLAKKSEEELNDIFFDFYHYQETILR